MIITYDWFSEDIAYVPERSKCIVKSLCLRINFMIKVIDLVEGIRSNPDRI
jgi:hypothetical protein